VTTAVLTREEAKESPQERMSGSKLPYAHGSRVAFALWLAGTGTQEKSGGGEWSRTTDAADMSRVNSDSNLLDLLTEILLEATDGDNPSSAS
jgi:hypothetical protein